MTNLIDVVIIIEVKLGIITKHGGGPVSIPERWAKFRQLSPNIDQKLTQLIPLFEKLVVFPAFAQEILAWLDAQVGEGSEV